MRNDVYNLKNEDKNILISKDQWSFNGRRPETYLQSTFYSDSRIQICDSLNISLTLSWLRSLSYRNHSIDLLCKSLDWFLYDKDLRHERVQGSRKSVQTRGKKIVIIMGR